MYQQIEELCIRFEDLLDKEDEITQKELYEFSQSLDELLDKSMNQKSISDQNN